jgi:ribonucleoside-diphosphate reductase beta chain
MSKVIDTLSIPGTKSELNIFEVPPTQVVVENTRWNEINLRNACTNTGPYEFHIGPNPQYLHLAKNYLFIQLRIVKENGDNLVHAAADPHVDPVTGPINLIGKTLIRQVKLALNGTEVFDSGDKYAYRAYLETELNFGSDAKGTYLQGAMYTADTPTNRIDDVRNTGLQSRAGFFNNSAWVEVMAPIHCDVFTQNKYLLNNIDVRLTLYRNSDSFCILSPEAVQRYRVEINSMKWYVKGVEISNAVSLALERSLMQYPAKYPIRRVELRTIHVNGGLRETPENAIFNGQIPRRLLIGCVDADAYHGTYLKSPFNFKNFNIDEVSITAAGQTYPAKPLTMDFPNNHYTRAFMQMFEGLGISDENHGNNVTLNKFKYGHCLFVFDLSPDEDDGSDHWDLVREGATTVNVHFAEPTPNGGVEIIVYGEFDNLLTITHSRNSFIDNKA